MCVGAVVRITKEALPMGQNQLDGNHEEEEEEDDDFVETFVGEKLGSFEHFTVWNHEALPDGGDDPYIKGLDEWIPFAEAVSFVGFPR
jgi:hypothetical protein